MNTTCKTVGVTPNGNGQGLGMGRRGFTLIELLVVIAIIAILASILFPVFARARENARRSSCASNLKQFGLAFMQYTQDYDESYPGYYIPTNEPAPGGPNWEPGVWYWPQILYPYHKSNQIFVCPSGVGAMSNAPVGGHYGSNLLITTNVAAGVASLKQSALSGPAGTYLAADWGNIIMHPAYGPGPDYNNFYLPGSGKLAGMPGSPNISSVYKSDYQNGRHLEGINIVFADGHVKWQRSEKVLQEAKNYLLSDGTKNAFDPANPAG
jgi:prepilin-type N-terminal cleavage/methylation domain-containing protein/prepilin-type processing-associated H-X9-DG protein